jgi:hypothetical protein
VHIIGDIFFIKNKIIIMSDLLDDNNHGYSGSEESFSAIGKSRMKSIASSVFTVGVIQVIFISLLFLVVLFFVGGTFFLPSNTPNNGIIKIAGIFGLAFIGFLFFYAFLMIQYGQKLSEFVQTGNQSSMEQALAKRKLYWTIAGIFSILGLCFSLFTLVQ